MWIGDCRVWIGDCIVWIGDCRVWIGIANGEGRMCEVNRVSGFECCLSIIFFSFLQLDVIILYLSYLAVEKIMHFSAVFIA